jgi:hypothetical protein
LGYVRIPTEYANVCGNKAFTSWSVSNLKSMRRKLHCEDRASFGTFPGS